MSDANPYEQQMLDLINADRLDAGLNPLVFNGDLNEASEDHSTWMLEADRFSHRGEGGSSSRERIEASGYELEGRWKTGENIAWVSEAGDNGLSDEVIRLHTNLMNSPEHRANLLNPEFKEIGIGIEAGDFVNRGRAIDAVFVTQNFGTTSANTVVLPEVASVATPTIDVPPVAPQVIPEAVEVAPAVQLPTFSGRAFDFSQFMASRGFSFPEANTNGVSNSSNAAPQTSTSRVEVVSVASDVDGPSVVVAGEGNFAGGGSATANDMIAENTGSGRISETPEAPTEVTSIIEDVQEASPAASDEVAATPGRDSMSFNFDDFILGLGPDVEVTTGSSTSSVDVTSVASEVDGPSVVVEGEGNFQGGGSATTNDRTAQDMASGTTGNAAAPSMAVVTGSTGNIVDADVELPVQTNPSPAMRFDFDSFVFNFGPNARMESGSTVSTASVMSVASTQNGPSVEILQMLGNVDLFGTAEVNGEVQSIADDDATPGFPEFAGMEFFSDFVF